MKNILISLDNNINLSKLDDIDIYILNESDSLNVILKQLVKSYDVFNLIISSNETIINDQDLTRLLKCLNDPLVSVVSPNIIGSNSIKRGSKVIDVKTQILRNIGVFDKYINRKYILYDNYRYETDLTSVDVPNDDLYIVSSNLIRKLDLNKDIPFYYLNYILGDICKLLNNQILINNNVKLSIVKRGDLSNDRLYYKEQYQYYSNYKKISFIDKVLLLITCKIRLLFLSLKKGEKNYDL